MDRLKEAFCISATGPLLLAAARAHAGLVPVIAAVVARAFSLALSARSIGKGVADLGFVAPALRGERRRHGGP